MTEKFTEFDPAEYLDTPEAIAAYLSEAMESGDTKFIARSIGIAAKARGMTDIAKETGVSREHLYRAFGENGNPTLKTTLSVMQALGVDLKAEPQSGLAR